jgi:hypothetical protein
MLCAVPALRALRAALGRCRITLVGLPWAHSFAERFPHYVDDFISFPGFPGLPEQTPDAAALPRFMSAARARRFDLAIQLHGDGRITNRLIEALGARTKAGFCLHPHESSAAFLPYAGAGPEVRRLLRLVAFLGAAADGEELEFPLQAQDATELARYAAERALPPHGYVCLHAGARALERRWPPERFAAAGDALHGEYLLPVVLTGSEQERPLAAQVCRAMRAPATNAAGPISAGGLAAMLARARLVVCNDTGVSHLAAALQVPSVVVFRASDMARWAPYDAQLHRPVWDPAATRLDEVLRQARTLLGPRRTRAATARAPAL